MHVKNRGYCCPGAVRDILVFIFRFFNFFCGYILLFIFFAFFILFLGVIFVHLVFSISPCQFLNYFFHFLVHFMDYFIFLSIYFFYFFWPIFWTVLFFIIFFAHLFFVQLYDHEGFELRNPPTRNRNMHLAKAHKNRRSYLVI